MGKRHESTLKREQRGQEVAYLILFLLSLVSRAQLSTSNTIFLTFVFD